MKYSKNVYIHIYIYFDGVKSCGKTKSDFSANVGIDFFFGTYIILIYYEKIKMKLVPKVSCIQIKY